MANFPVSLDSYTTKVDNVDDVMAVDINALQAAIVALETKVGIDSSIDSTTLDYKIGRILPRSYMAGLALSNAADADHDITVAVGACKDSTNSYDMTLAAAMTKQIDASWASGDAAGGLFTGTVGSTWYQVFLIRKDSDGSIDVGFDTSITAANKPAGYTAYRRLGSVKTDGGNIIAFIQRGDIFMWKSPILDLDAEPTSTSRQTFTVSVPSGVTVEGMFNVGMSPATGTGGLYLSCPDVTDMAPSSTVAPLMSIAIYAPSNIDVQVRLVTNTSSQICSRCTEAGRNWYLSTLGWVDRRGRDD